MYSGCVKVSICRATIDQNLLRGISLYPCVYAEKVPRFLIVNHLLFKHSALKKQRHGIAPTLSHARLFSVLTQM
jgi:hypothetical protein